MSDPKIDGSDIFPWEDTASFLFFSSQAHEIYFINLDTLGFSAHIFYLAKSKKNIPFSPNVCLLGEIFLPFTHT